MYLIMKYHTEHVVAAKERNKGGISFSMCCTMLLPKLNVTASQFLLFFCLFCTVNKIKEDEGIKQRGRREGEKEEGVRVEITALVCSA
jgi:hypothetical protein